MDFEKLAQQAEEVVRLTLADIPEDIRRKAESVPVFLEKMPDDEDVSSGIADDTLGLFDEGDALAPTPRIRLWLENLWEYSEGDPAIFREEVSTTLLHELGHYFGWNEEDLDERGLG